MHILNGDSATSVFRQALHPVTEELLVFRDVLSCGRLRAYVAIKQWAKCRRDYWQEICIDQGLGSIDKITAAPNDFYNDFEKLKCAEKINLWIGGALSDHLLFVFLVKLIDIHGLDFNRLAVHQYTSLNNKNLAVVSLGMLKPEQVKELQPEPFTLDNTQITFCLDVWAAITASTSDKLMQILGKKQTSLPLLTDALKNLFYRFPKLSNGLNHFDETILNAVKECGPSAAHVIGHALICDEYPHRLDTVGDIYLFSRLKNMAQASLNKPLLSLNILDASLRKTTTEITAFGLEVLDSRRNAVNVNGIDDWVGGIHLNASTGRIWFRRDEELVLQWQ